MSTKEQKSRPVTESPKAESPAPRGRVKPTVQSRGNEKGLAEFSEKTSAKKTEPSTQPATTHPCTCTVNVENMLRDQAKLIKEVMALKHKLESLEKRVEGLSSPYPSQAVDSPHVTNATAAVEAESGEIPPTVKKTTDDTLKDYEATMPPNIQFRQRENIEVSSAVKDTPELPQPATPPPVSPPATPCLASGEESTQDGVKKTPHEPETILGGGKVTKVTTDVERGTGTSEVAKKVKPGETDGAARRRRRKPRILRRHQKIIDHGSSTDEEAYEVAPSRLPSPFVPGKSSSKDQTDVTGQESEYFISRPTLPLSVDHKTGERDSHPGTVREKPTAPPVVRQREEIKRKQEFEEKKTEKFLSSEKTPEILPRHDRKDTARDKQRLKSTDAQSRMPSEKRADLPDAFIRCHPGPPDLSVEELIQDWGYDMTEKPTDLSETYCDNKVLNVWHRLTQAPGHGYQTPLIQRERYLDAFWDRFFTIYESEGMADDLYMKQLWEYREKTRQRDILLNIFKTTMTQFSALGQLAHMRVKKVREKGSTLVGKTATKKWQIGAKRARDAALRQLADIWDETDTIEPPPVRRVASSSGSSYYSDHSYNDSDWSDEDGYSARYRCDEEVAGRPLAAPQPRQPALSKSKFCNFVDLLEVQYALEEGVDPFSAFSDIRLVKKCEQAINRGLTTSSTSLVNICSTPSRTDSEAKNYNKKHGKKTKPKDALMLYNNIMKHLHITHTL
ncbi:uncharacterized protein LOC106156580 isoform X2 [Lingula anatina]|uniref:Uncharacterized protein LOC106156580 isoform X2 n=1 Tax=Lingula anatina TaxID=7574 RepID=A0A1S3HMR2_LINAN|nr:uncharacterized protein LOC106156580 isoform X2 [Lingula anatina]|eukprot:XP_013387355.1 uncharacterized protein LOC106156580 isoform X2 [Lingula anatina]